MPWRVFIHIDIRNGISHGRLIIDRRDRDEHRRGGAGGIAVTGGEGEAISTCEIQISLWAVNNKTEHPRGWKASTSNGT